MADLQTVNKHLLKNEKDLKSGVKKAQEEKMVLEKIKNILEAGDLASKANLSGSETEIIKDLHLLTLKPFIFVFNANNGDKKYLNNVNRKIRSVDLNLKLEVEISEMEEAEAKEFKSESHLDNLIKAAYELLGLITYFTTGEDETRGWTIKAGYTAPRAGAAIHNDFEEKFIKAEVINWQKLLECGSWSAARDKGILKTEGKEYIVQDGDVIEFKI